MVETKRPRGRPRIEPDAIPPQVEAYWRSGELTLEDVASIAACSEATAARLMVARGGPLDRAMQARARRTSRLIALTHHVIELHKEGCSGPQIAVAAGITRQRVQQILREHYGGFVHERCAHCGGIVLAKWLRPPVFCPACVETMQQQKRGGA